MKKELGVSEEPTEVIYPEEYAKEIAANQAMHEYVEYCRCMELHQIKEALKESNL